MQRGVEDQWCSALHSPLKSPVTKTSITDSSSVTDTAQTLQLFEHQGIMWVLEKIRESIESIPLELSHVIGKSEEDIFISSKTRLSQNLHNNILTPDKIPEFCLPPRLCRRSREAETTAPHQLRQNQVPKSGTCSGMTREKTKHAVIRNSDVSVAWKDTKKPLPFSAEGYGLAGIYESPNTRRKESIFHSKFPIYMLDRSIAAAAPRLAKVKKVQKKPMSGIFPQLCKSLSETGSTESETSSDSSPLSSPYTTKSSFYDQSGSGRLKGATSCPLLIGGREEMGSLRREVLSLQTFPSSPPSSLANSLTLAPPVLFPLDVLQCQERLQREHVVPLLGRGKVRLSAESTTFSTNTLLSLFTVRVRVVSVEGLSSDTNQQTLNCAVNLCLTPGKLQPQKSATIRNCHSLVFNEDFYFTALSREDLLELQLKLKVVDKPAAGTLRRGTVIGVFTKPLSQLLNLHKWV
ncbi:C2 calcium-dependent domain-containing protein 4C-like [Solea senegalensis]|uniref:C2 calcium-dependent domain-containing protein 4C-like n=2 Tax=Solea senegalensis TaxID=28829 RepID=A0AAV6QFL0_SOLSE|nr:C2 calcium-dependent domain-containing protein 4C-like [Solea senegalensis]